MKERVETSSIEVLGTPAGCHGKAFAWDNQATAEAFDILTESDNWSWTLETLNQDIPDALRAQRLAVNVRSLIEAQCGGGMTGRFALVGMRRVNWSQLVEQLVIYRIRRNSRPVAAELASPQ
jgi:hypothetical protein